MKKTDKLRERAEKKLQKADKEPRISGSESELVHELQVHQTELEMQNEELRNSQIELSKLYEEYHELYNEAPVGYFSLDKNGNIRNVNIKGAELLGLKKDRIIGMGFIIFIPINYQTKYYRSLKDAVVKRKIQEVELQLKRDKITFYVQMEIMHIHDKPDEKYRITITDITERKKAEQALKESEDKFSKVFYANPAAVSISDEEGNFIEANESFLKLTGYNRDELIGHTTVELNLLDVEKREQYLTKFKEKGSIKDLEFEMRTKFGEKRNIIGSGEFLEIDGKIRVIYFLYDITERKLMEEELRKAHDNLEKQVDSRTVELQMEKDILNDILNTTKSGVYIVNSDYELEYVNPTIEKDFGINKGQKCYEYFYNDHDVCSNCKIHKAFEGEDVEWVQHSLKSNKTYDALATPIIKYSDSISVVVFLYDVTRRDEAEKELKESIDELKNSNEELKRFAYITSHDLQEPLRTMSSYAGLLKMRYGGQLDSDADDFLDYMVKGASRMKDMIQGLLDYSSVGTQGEEFIEFNSEEALNHALSNLRFSIEDCHAEVTYDKLPTVNADKEQISRVFQNLIGNAIKFKKPDEPPKIHISAGTDKIKNECVFSVSDNGIGMEKQYTNKIFEVFKRLHTIDAYEGTGIGLAIVKRIMERHSGCIWVKSVFGMGSTFYFTIPITKGT